MKKLALIKRDFHSLGGLEKVTSRLVETLLKKGVDITLFTTASSLLNRHDPPSLPLMGHFPSSPTVCIYQPERFLKAQQLRGFDQWLSEHLSRSTFDIIFSMDRCSVQTHHRAGNGVHAAYLNLRSQREGRLKKWSFSLNPLHHVQLELERQTFESPQTELVIVNSALVQNDILRYYNTPAEKINIIHNGVEWNEFETDFNDSILHRREHILHLGLDPSVYQFLFVGHNFERKGLEMLLRALALLTNKNFHLSVVGHDKKISFYRSLTHRLGLGSQVTFFGAQTSSKPFYLAADALVIPSIYDPFANVTVEALALGLFVVTSTMNGGHEILHPYSGLTLENSQNIEELAHALEQAFSHPKTADQATQIRSSVAHLDYALQLEKICQLCRI